MVGLGCIAAARAISGCRTEEPSPVRGRPLTYAGIPTIRVLISSRAAERISIATTGGYRLLVDGRCIDASDGPLAATAVSRRGNTWCVNDLFHRGERMVLEPGPDAHVRAGETVYRGSLRFISVGEGQFLVVNDVNMESYLAGVLAKELYPSWAPQTYRALAVAARTFATYHMLTFGESHEFDLGSTQAAQVYGGLSAETDKSWEAVRSTHGQVLTCGADGDERVFMAQYSSSCGGRVNGARVLRDAEDIAPLRGGQECDDCASSSRYRWAPVRIAKADLHRALAASYKAAGDLPDVAELRPAGQTPHGRIVWVDVLSADGRSIRLRADDVRLALLRSGVPGARSLYSMNCSLRTLPNSIEFYDGKGFGHGVGLCQWGAQGKAVKGATGEEILEFYYPGAKILRAY